MIKAVIFDMYETLVSLFTCPTYMGHDVSVDLGIDEKKFREIWNASEDDRSIGKITFEEVIERIMRVNNIYSEELFKRIFYKRKTIPAEAFNNMHSEIIPMMEKLKENGKKIALISNCFYEERDNIMQSKLWKYFDCKCLSCELGIKKPDIKIYKHCLNQLSLKPEECLYVGDGGSYELETAELVGMNAAQACWYLDGNTRLPDQRKNGFVHLEKPLEVCKLAENN